MTKMRKRFFFFKTVQIKKEKKLHFCVVENSNIHSNFALVKIIHYGRKI